METYLRGLAEHVRTSVVAVSESGPRRRIRGLSPGGDPQFGVDEVAEDAAWDWVTGADLPMAVYSEDHGLRVHGRSPEHVLVIDPIDGTRPAAAGLEMATVSIAAARFTDRPRIADVEFALLCEMRTGATLYGDHRRPGIVARGYDHPVPALSTVTDPSLMFWSIEFNGHPAAMMTGAYGHLIDVSANTGAVFVFSSASYSISRIITGQLDAYVDIGNRLLRDDPGLLGEFERVGNGHVLHLFPYDIAAAVFLAERAGVVITDGYGAPLGETVLTDLAVDNQRSCVAAGTTELHRRLLDEIRW